MTDVLIDNRLHAATDWFDGDVRPAREGVYERLFPAGPYSCWNGQAWNDDAHAPLEATTKTGLSPQQSASWRGLVAQADAPCATCRGHTVVDRGVDAQTGADLIVECPECG